jgi:preprotein translocase subunit SecA
LLKLVSRFAGDPNEKELDRLQPLVDEVGELEPRFKDLTDQQLRDQTPDFLARLDAGQGLDDLLPEAFAAVREASKRTTTMRHFDVQILGGVILHEGKVVEMKTGEGKTLVATLPLYLNAGDGQRLPGSPRRPMDGSHLPSSGLDGRTAPTG